MAVATAVISRFWQLGTYPPGLYRDEAFNGLDALAVLDGPARYLLSAANNGREPGYIYLTAVAINILGRTPLAVRIGAAIVGSLTTIVVYLLGKSWFGKQTAVYAAWLWAITLWPIHLSRVGLRPILLPIMLGLTFWLGTKAYRKRSNWLWLAAGICYGLGFYTYLAIRFTPLLLLFILIYLGWQKRPLPKLPPLFSFATGAIAALFPLLLWIAQDPSRILGRSNQVSIFNPIINGGNLWGTLWLNIWRSLGLLIWRGDTILRHNPAGRPVFDWVMAIPLLIGVGYCLYNWKRPSATILLLWTVTMLGPTILAEDTPHFLRAVGILPAIIYFPALGLTTGQQWLVEKWSTRNTQPKHPFTPSPLHLFTPILLALSLFNTIIDYKNYSQDPEAALLFEAAALELAESMAAEDEETAVYMDRWFWDDEQQGWPTIPFIANLDTVADYRPEFNIPPPDPNQPVSIYGWQFGSLDFVPTLITPPATVNIHTGGLARGDLEENSYPLYVRYHASPTEPNQIPLAQFEDQFKLMATHTEILENELLVNLWWEAETAVSQEWAVFVHLIGLDGLVAQDDGLPAAGYWQFAWWQPGLHVQDSHKFDHSIPF